MTIRRVFWFLLLLAIALAIHYRQVELDVANLGYRFSRLYFTKELVTKLDIHGTSVYVYAEQVNDKHLKILDIENLQSILKKTYNDYLAVIEKLYPEILEDYPKTARMYPRKESLTIIFVSPETYESLTKIKKRDSSGYVGFLNIIYFKTYGNNYQINAMKTTIRHEIFHYLNNYYGITAEFEEVAAKRFGGT